MALGGGGVRFVRSKVPLYTGTRAPRISDPPRTPPRSYVQAYSELRFLKIEVPLQRGSGPRGHGRAYMAAMLGMIRNKLVLVPVMLVSVRKIEFIPDRINTLFKLDLKGVGFRM